MAGKNVKLPVIGTVRQDYLVVGGATVAGVVGFMYWRARNTAASAGPLPTVDPGAGLIENTPAYMSSGAPGLYGPDTDPGNNDPRPGNFVNNAEWFQWAVDYLDGQLGIDRGHAGTALSKFLDKERLTTAELETARKAIAAAGQPPQNGPFQLLPIVGGNTAPPPGSSSGKPGPVTGLVFEGGNAFPDLTWRWKAASGAVRYRVRLIQGANTVVPGSETTITRTRWRVRETYRGPLARNSAYRIEVWPISGSGVQGDRASANGRTG